MSKLFLTGFSDDHITNQESVSLQPEVHSHLNDLKNLAAKHEIELEVLSSYRSFTHQKKIWNEKAAGKRDLLDSDGHTLDFNSLSKTDLLHSILRWSALPGMSRHHWGTDIDVVDRAVLKQNPSYKVRLTPSEYSEAGIFSNLARFLESEDLIKVGFFRPYKVDLGGVAPEPWHLSYAALAKEQEELLDLEFFEQWLHAEPLKDLLLLEQLKSSAKEIFKRYVTNTQANPIA